MIANDKFNRIIKYFITFYIKSPYRGEAAFIDLRNSNNIDERLLLDRDEKIAHASNYTSYGVI